MSDITLKETLRRPSCPSIQNAMELAGRKLGEILEALGIVRPPQIAAALEYAGAWECPMGQALIELSFVEERHVLLALALQSQTEVRDLSGLEVSTDMLKLVPAATAVRHCAVPIGKLPAGIGDKAPLIVAMSRPTDVAALAELSRVSRTRIQPVVAAESEILEAIVRLYRVDPTDELDLAS